MLHNDGAVLFWALILVSGASDHADVGCNCVETRVSNSLIIPPRCAMRWHRPGQWCYVEPSLSCPNVYVDSVVENSFWAYCEEITTAPSPAPTVVEFTDPPTPSPTDVRCSGDRNVCNGHGFFIERASGDECFCACDESWTGHRCDRPVAWECPEGRIEIGGALITTPRMEHNELVTMLCPQGYLGNVQFLCSDSTVSVFYGTCVLNLFTTYSPTESLLTQMQSTKAPTVLPTSLLPTSFPSVHALQDVDPILQADVLQTESAEEESMRNYFLYAALLAGVLLLVLCAFLTWCCIYRINPFQAEEDKYALEYVISKSQSNPPIGESSDCCSGLPDDTMVLSYVDVKQDPWNRNSSVPVEYVEDLVPVANERAIVISASRQNLMSSRSTSLSRTHHQSVSNTPLKRRAKKSYIFSDCSSMSNISSSNRSRSRQREKDVQVLTMSQRKVVRRDRRPSADNPILEINDGYGAYNPNDHIVLSPIRETDEDQSGSQISADETHLYIHKPRLIGMAKPPRRRGETTSQSREGRVSMSFTEEGSTITTSRSSSKMRCEVRHAKHVRRVVPRRQRYKPVPPPRAVYESRQSV